MNRPNPTPPLACVTCELEIAGRPEFLAGLPFCCAGCAVGGPCSCSYDVLEDVYSVVATAGTAPEPVLAGMSRV